MIKRLLTVLSIILTLLISTGFVVYRYKLGFRDEQLYLVYFAGFLVWFVILFFYLFVNIIYSEVK